MIVTSSTAMKTPSLLDVLDVPSLGYDIRVADTSDGGHGFWVSSHSFADNLLDIAI